MASMKRIKDYTCVFQKMKLRWCIWNNQKNYKVAYIINPPFLPGAVLSRIIFCCKTFTWLKKFGRIYLFLMMYKSHFVQNFVPFCVQLLSIKHFEWTSCCNYSTASITAYKVYSKVKTYKVWPSILKKI
jgi:hypothetical protein